MTRVGACGRDARDALERLRDVVAGAVDTFIERLDREGGSADGDRSYRRLLSGANQLEHFLVCTKASSFRPADGNDREARSDGEAMREHHASGIVDDDNGHALAKRETPTLDYHTDAGFFLAFIPAMSCRRRVLLLGGT